MMQIHQAKPIRSSMLPSRRAVTLVELLIVMAVVILLAGITLPTVRNVLKDQRTTECARLFSTMVEAARAKAVYTGRPVALILERMPGDPAANSLYNLPLDNTCHRLSLGEVFPPYEGDWAGSKGTIPTATVPTILDIPLAQAASLIDPTTGTPTGLVQPFDLIQFGEHPHRFIINSLQLFNGNVRITFQNPPAGYVESQWSVSGGETRFRIFRQPTKSVVGSVSLPKGTCIDLTNSGVGLRYVPQPLPPLTLPPPPVANYDFEVSARSTGLPVQYTNVYIIFNSRGAVDTCYYFDYGRPAIAQRVVIPPTGLYFFQVGRVEQVVHSTYMGSTTATEVSTRDDFKPNLYDTSNLWVTLNPYSGSVTTSTNAPCNQAAYRGVQILEARQLAAQALSNGKN